jgi:hypothetical protein
MVFARNFKPGEREREQKVNENKGRSKGSRIQGLDPAKVFPMPRRPYQGGYMYYPMRYNFETGIWSNDHGEKFKNGIRVE